MGTHTQGVALGWHVPRRWRLNSAAVKTAITWPGEVRMKQSELPRPPLRLDRGLEPLAELRKEFAPPDEAKARRAEKAGASESLGRGEGSSRQFDIPNSSFDAFQTARVLASVFSIGVTVKPINDAFGKAPRRLLAKP